MSLRAIKVRDYMAHSIITFRKDTSVLQAIKILIDNGISGAPVVDNLGNLIGMLSEKDCMKVALDASYHESAGAGDVGDYMFPKVETVDADANILDIAERFLKEPFRRFPVIHDDRLVGQISRRDVLRALDRMWDKKASAVD